MNIEARHAGLFLYPNKRIINSLNFYVGRVFITKILEAHYIIVYLVLQTNQF